MIDINQWFKTGLNALTDNAPTILTAFGAVGVVGTAVLTGKATFEAADRLRDAKLENAEAYLQQNPGSQINDENYADMVPSNFESFKLVWVLYVPAATTGVLSIAAIVMSHRISSRRAAVLAAAYALNESKLEEYQDKIKEKFGVKKEKDARDELAQSKVDRDYDSTEVIFSPLDGKVLIRDDYSGRFFYGTVDAVNKAVNEINADILMEDSKTLTDFYSVIGLSKVSTSDYFGWNTHDRLEIDWSTCTTPDGNTAVHSFAFVNEPIMNPGNNASFR